MSEDGISEEVEEEEREPNIAAFAAPAAEHRTASEALAAGEWKQVWEPSAKRWYYRHRATGIAVWDLEKELARRLRQDVPTVRDALRDGAWKMAFDEFNRRLYYYHPDTRMSCWELTPGMVDEANRRVAGKEQPAAERDPAAEAPAEPTADDAADLSLGHHASISPLRSVGPRVPPVFDESLPGSQRAMAVLADGSWVYDWDDQGLLFFRETVTRRTVRDLRAEMAQILAEERMAAALDESNRMSFADLMAASRSYPTQATQARSPGVQPSSPPPPASGHERSPTTVPQTPPNQPTSPHTPLPKESPAWQLEEGASALSPPEDGEAEVTPPPPATPDGAGDDHAGGQPAVVHDYRRGPPTPDFNSMPLGETACVFTATEELSLLNQELQADDDQIDFAPIVRTLPRRTKYNAREKWGPIEYMTDENRSAAELTVQRAQFQRQMEDSLLRIRAGHNEAMQDLAPLARPPPEELGPYYPQESRLGPHIAASSLAASPHTQGASYTRLDEPASPWRNPVSAIRLRRTAPSQYVLSPNEEHLTYVSA